MSEPNQFKTDFLLYLNNELKIINENFNPDTRNSESRAFTYGYVECINCIFKWILEREEREENDVH